jgi:hypothetical protein
MSLGKGCTAALLALPGEALHLRYLEIPLLVKLSVPGRVAPYLVAGPSLGLRHSAELIRDDYRDDHVYVEDVTHDTKTAELSLEAGVGVGLSVGRGYGFFEASWAWGLTSVSQDFGKNRGMQFRLGVTVRLGS